MTSRAVQAAVDGRHRPVGQQLVAVGPRCRSRSRAGSPARVHLKIDTGLSRNGAYRRRLAGPGRGDGQGRRASTRSGSGATSPTPTSPATRRSASSSSAFREALEVAESRGMRAADPSPRQLRGHAHPARRAFRSRPSGHRRLRTDARAARGRLRARPRDDAACGAGLGQAGACRRGRVLRPRVHRPATTRRSRSSRSGYADGIPRHATNVGPVSINGQRFTISGRVCMDQFVVDVGDLPSPSVTRQCCSGRDARANRSRRTGPTRSAPSTTRSSRGSVPRVPRTYRGGDRAVKGGIIAGVLAAAAASGAVVADRRIRAVRRSGVASLDDFTAPVPDRAGFVRAERRRAALLRAGRPARCAADGRADPRLLPEPRRPAVPAPRPHRRVRRAGADRQLRPAQPRQVAAQRSRQRDHRPARCRPATRCSRNWRRRAASC